jgi:hypothetical protein
MEHSKIKIGFLVISMLGLLLLLPLKAEAEEAYPEWKIKLAYTLLAKGSDVEHQDPNLAREYYSRAERIYPQIVSSKSAPKPVEALAVDTDIVIAKSTDLNSSNLSSSNMSKSSIRVDSLIEPGKELSKDLQQTSNEIEDRATLLNVQIQETVKEERPLITVKKRENEEERTLPKITKPDKKQYKPKAEDSSEYPEGAIIAKFQSVDARQVYRADKIGPTVNKILDPYYINHKNFRIPYFKDREGLKIHPWIGVRGEYIYDEQRVGIESLIMEAKEFNQRRNDQVRDYISMNKKELYRQEVILHIREWLPKFTFINHEETVKRKYQAKRLWPSNDIYYDNYDRRYYQLEHTIPNLKKLGYLKLKLRYGDELSYRTNDEAAYLPFNSYMGGFETSPHISRLGRVKIRFEYEYWKGEYKRAAEQGWSEREAHLRSYLLELELYNQKKFLRITPHFNWKRERHSPSQDTWWTKKVGLKLQKNINGKLVYTTDWTYIDYIRVNPITSSTPKINSKCWTWENEIEYEVVRDLKFTLGMDYGKGFGFDSFDNITGRGELMLRKPGLIDLRFGYRYTDYFNVNDNVDTVYFKLGLFI